MFGLISVKLPALYNYVSYNLEKKKNAQLPKVIKIQILILPTLELMKTSQISLKIPTIQGPLSF